MRVHILQHVPYEPPANIEKYLKEKNLKYSFTKFFNNEPFPDFSSFDVLIVMGGPMGVYDEDKFPFLKKEKVFIENAIKLGKKIFGVCLGAQLIADVLGAKVYKNNEKEIGWFPIYLTEEGKNTNIFNEFPKELIAFHWHGDTFEIPSGFKRVFYNETTQNQAFINDNETILGLQFHFEVSKESVKQLIENSKEELDQKGKFIQSKEQILSTTHYFPIIKTYLYKTLDKFMLI
jgi:GMP synthase (glutamine-hydrolysing)